ncbi:MAG: aspartate--tRNA ligase [Omnitrophica bacterium RIFCSPHIGHO2_02_FULL_46_11]|nr:MAG: aspartate--tRNA ligase [Omnitrophica bacterium RIFCSPHIGHO2_02_FULL_46_11]OGW87684.1 MAG: aspartate--tRNA ligase [Omnitrophica bacterium RIFCSPLOWO2_01_FULL_45_10b]
MLRTHHCGELTAKHISNKVTLCGWVDTRRDHGNLIFIDLRDRWGKTQLIFNPEKNREIHCTAEKLRSEFVVQARGVVQKRPEGTLNPKIQTGQIEVEVTELQILNASEVPPFEIVDDSPVSEEIRLKYRYLDLRRPAMFKRLQTRHRITKIVRDYLDEHHFIEVETPMLTKSTPEGARDFLVPSRLSAGTFYALPQSPQLFKQILMISGFDRYFQLARCLRDEDLRADRQPEHTQIDIEMSFVSEDDIISMIEGLLARVIKAIRGVDVKTPFPRLSYQDTMNRFGSDKPDLRFGLEFQDATSLLGGSELKIFQEVVKQKGVVKGLSVSGANFSRSDFDRLIAFVQGFGAKGLAWIKVAADGIESPIGKFLKPDEQKKLITLFRAKAGDTIFLIADQWLTTCAALGALRNQLAGELKLIPQTKELNLAWIVDFPLFQWSEEEKRLDAVHHPFTAPQEADLAFFDKEPLKVKARAYDIIFNGTEVGGGSIRIHQEEVQKKVFHSLGITDQDAEGKFGFLLRALRFGAPPHGGIAIGLDRLCAILEGVESIRDVIAFPKTQKGSCPMTEAPSKVSDKQLKELHLQIKPS